MAKGKGGHLIIRSLLGGINDSDEPTSLPDDQAVDCRNIDFSEGLLGRKRAGSSALSLAGSVFANSVPSLATKVTGGATGASSASANLAATANDGTGTTYTRLLVWVSTKANTDITGVTYGGVPLVQLQEAASAGSGRLECWGLANASLAGGSVAVTAAGACDIAFEAQFWQRVSAAAASAGVTATSNTPRSTINTDPTTVVADGTAFDTGVTATANAGQSQSANLSQGNARLATSFEIGRKPSVVLDWTLSGSVQWVHFTVTLTGAPSSAFPGVGAAIIALIRHTPSNDNSEDEIWAVDSHGRIDRYASSAWNLGVPVVNQYVGILNLLGVDVNGASLHGKLFFSAQSGLDRLMVWDGTVLRHAGHATPAAPSVADTAVGGAYATTRYFRVRYVTQDADGVVLVRSEPSTATTFNPNGAFDGAVITKPSGTEDFTSAFSNGQTHWEVEASLDNVLFYRIATVAIGTATYTDNTPAATGYSSNTLSEDIGEYTPPGSVRHVTVDEDRLFMAGSRTYELYDSTCWWTPVGNATGAGNDERVPTTTANTLTLDGLDGGNITALITGENGAIYAAKLQRLYRLIRTGILAAAYIPHTESRHVGAISRAMVSGHDEAGRPCVYFLDPERGLCRLGIRGVENFGDDVYDTFVQIDPRAKTGLPQTYFPPRMTYYPRRKQVWMLWPLSSTIPNRLVIFNTRYGSGGRKGYSYYDGVLANNFCIGSFALSNSVEQKPLLGGWNQILISDTGVNDNGTRYRAYIRTKPYLLGDLLQKFEMKKGVLLAKAASGVVLSVDLIRDFGKETVQRAQVTLTASAAGETHVIRPMDNAYISECFAVQLEIGDPSSYSGAQLDQTWILDEVLIRHTMLEEATS